ncbi:MAG: archaellin/type IV pilin N-terminal domain-containing protein [Thermoplasmataceae archaeon]
MNYLRKLKKFLLKPIKNGEDRTETGIGMLIVFIAMILVAAVAAAVLLHTVGVLQTRATATGTQTIQQVSSGITVTGIIGYDNASPPASGGISQILIFLKPSSGSPAINLANISLELSIGSSTAILHYNSSVFANEAAGSVNIFNVTQWNLLSKSQHNPTSFGVFVAFDPANSVTARFPILSQDDVVGLMINVSNTFGYNITQGSLLTGQLIIPIGSPAIIDLTAPTDFSTKTITLE